MNTLLDQLAAKAGYPLDGFPHARALGLRLHQDEEGALQVTVPYDERLIGDPATGVIHGGVVTTLLDTGCGMAAILRLRGEASVATLDLRIDYMRPSKPGHAIHGACECYRLTRSVAFCRGVAYDESRDDPVATAAAAFMITPLEAAS
ncbi:PaaI family thioesterase [Pikeienuella sp. HZG-20]|uniref:PaaI family thioesterase n=1 Tax=Paludibacillus litoralis TaxID=3133267 RepID=UPI0030EDEDC5